MPEAFIQARTFGAIIKDGPSVSSVHVARATDNVGARSFKQTLEERKKVRKADFSFRVDFAKNAAGDGPMVEEHQRLVFGWANVIEEGGQAVEDYQHDVISEAELEKAFYDFTEYAGRGAGQADDMHDWTEGGPLVECMVFTKEKQKILGIDLGKVGAWVGFRVRPDIFEKIKSGEYKSMSIGGSGVRVTIED